jgi:hypothetical protein
MPTETEKTPKKTIVFYGRDPQAAKDRHPTVAQDSFQLIQADAYNGERLEADDIEFMDDVSAGDQARIRELWGKFDNRQNIEKSGPVSLGGVQRTPGSDRSNLNPATRTDDPKKVEAKELEHPGVAPKRGAAAETPKTEDKKGVGLDQTTGKPATSRDTIPR